MDLLCFCPVLCLLCLCARLFICALWSPAGKGLTSWLSFVVSAVSLSLSHWYPGSGVIVSIPDLCTFTYFDLTRSDFRDSIGSKGGDDWRRFRTTVGRIKQLIDRGQSGPDRVDRTKQSLVKWWHKLVLGA